MDDGKVRDLVEECRNLCLVEREAVLMEVEAEDPSAADEIRARLAAVSRPGSRSGNA